MLHHDIYSLNEALNGDGFVSDVQKRNRLLCEDQASKSISQAKRLVMNKLKYDETEADDFVRVKLRSDIPVLRTPQGGKFILGAARMFCDGELRTAQDISNLNATLKYVASDAHINEYDRNLNGLSLNDIVNRFAKSMTDDMEADKSELARMQWGDGSDYDIVRIDDFGQSRRYGKYTEWCVTHDKNMFDSYTSDGINQFYFCLRKGFENVPKKRGEGCPLDEYGLSMIAVCVNENGMLNTCTCRWNHDNGGNDAIMNPKQISEVIGRNFYDVFKPNNKFREAVARAQEALRNGAAPQDIFDEVGEFSDGLAPVKLNSKFNFINKDGVIQFKQWYDWVGDFSDGLAKVELNDRWNFINKNGVIQFEQWYNWAGDFHEGLAPVQLDGQYNFINKDGLIQFKQWYDFVGNFSNGLVPVTLDGKYNFINKDGVIQFKQWYDWAGNFSDGLAAVKLNGKWNFINKNGVPLSEQWYDVAWDFSEGLAQVELNDKWNFINEDGAPISKHGFGGALDFSEGLAPVKMGGKWNYINKGGVVQFKQGFDDVDNFYNGLAKVKLDGKRYYIDKEGNYYDYATKHRIPTPLDEAIRRALRESLQGYLRRGH